MNSLFTDFSSKLMDTMKQNQDEQNQNHKLLSNIIDDIKNTSDSKNDKDGKRSIGIWGALSQNSTPQLHPKI